MGVPKFFRYISERYPCLSEVVKEYQIPDFDNLYLDMNGIIHNCSHPDDDDPHFRISEEKIFQDIFHYIEILFRMIQPRKLFFMAIDGVAPRAKMNQQRARRFRSAKDAEKMEEKALKKGEVLPSEERFDSNCITPGTEFMAKLHEQLKYFIVNKISTDKLWRKCRVILSGHETPGEGEHKIMDYIRYMRSQPGYDPNTRHCLYGLDADLIMLGLCTHEPHFSLLREEVKFGKKANKRRSAPEDIKFYLLHLSLMREYLGLEFKDLETNNQLTFKYDIENIIDDWVLMGFLVGNDFIPHLPNLHIAQGALPILYKTYMKVLPTFDGYINEAGTLNLARFEKFMESLAEIDLDNFQEQYADLKYFEAKTGRRMNEDVRRGNKLEAWEDNDGDLIDLEPLEPTKPMSSDLAALIKNTDDMFLDPSDATADNLETEGDTTEYDSDASESEMFQMEFKQHKRDYYTNKLEYASVTPEVLRAQAEGYVRAIQWNLNYYYNGCCSWSWYYPHHYAPYISDIKGFADLKITFDFGRPFKPYEQLLAVLPPASKRLLPTSYHKLMLDENSIIKSFYPEEFATDLNGKKAEWEAVVLIPFIDEKLLLEAMEPCNLALSTEEIKRNTHGPMLIYEHTTVLQEPYQAPEYFPAVQDNFAICTHLTIDDIRVPENKLIKGAYPGAKYDVYFPGFPTTKHLPYMHRIENIKVRVHEQPSRNESMVLTLDVKEQTETLDTIARELLGRTVYVGWPHLVEALVVSVSDKRFRYHHSGNKGQYNTVENKGNVEKDWQLERNTISEYYKTRFGVEVGEVSVLVHVRVMVGRRYMFMPNGRVTLEKEWCPTTCPYPLQSIVKDILVHDEEYSSYRDIENVFPVGTSCWMLGHPCYGCVAEIKDSKDTLKNGRLKVLVKSCEEPNLEPVKAFEREMRTKYMNLHEASSRLALSKILFSRITGAILVSASTRFHTTDDTNKINIGLNLKFSKRNEEVPGYTRKEGNTWLYTEKAVELVQDFQNFCPELFQYLNTHNENMYYTEDIFPNGNGKEMLASITQWIKKQPFYSLERRSCGSMLMDPDVVKELENTIENYKKAVKVNQISMQVKPHVLYKPDLFMGNVPPDNGTTYQLYDRVVNVRECYTVPLGLRGTIIAIHKSSTGKEADMVYDILFDEPFPGGLALNCSPNRGYRLPNAALINKSYGQRVYEQKCGVAKTAQKATQSSDQMSYFYPQYGPPMQNTQFNQRYVMTNPNRTNKAGKQPIILSREEPQKIPPLVVDPPTNLLKQMLKIDDGNTSKPSKNNVSEAKKITVEDIFKLHKNPQFVQQPPVQVVHPAQEPKAIPKFNSVRLLEYFQSNSLGLPHYSYFNVANNQIQAQLLHPLTGNVVDGAPCANKQDACENVAGKALHLIAKGSITTTPLPPQVPQPPRNWTVQNRQAPERGHKQKPSPVKPHADTTKKSHTQHALQQTPGASGNVSSSASAFVPLQAVRKHITKHSTSKDGPPKENGGNSTKSDKADRRVNQNAQNTSQKSSDQSTSSQKPMRRRRMRLAANFDTKPTI